MCECAQMLHSSHAHRRDRCAKFAPRQHASPSRRTRLSRFFNVVSLSHLVITRRIYSPRPPRAHPAPAPSRPRASHKSLSPHYAWLLPHPPTSMPASSLSVWVRVRENGHFFFRRAPRQLHLTTTHVVLGERRLPLTQLSLSPGLRLTDVVLTAPGTVLCVRAAHATDAAQWRALVSRLSISTAAPPGFAFVDELGRGSFGVVYDAVDQRTARARRVAVKQVTKSQLARRRLPLSLARRELHVVTAVPPHPNIVRTYTAFETTTCLYVVMEFVAGGTLLSHARRSPLSLADVRHVIMQLLRALAHLHSCSIIHRDVKMENILLHRSATTLEPKLCDFGLAVRHTAAKPSAAGDAPQSQLHHTAVGTRYARAPEMLLAAESGRARARYCAAVDVWACGIVMFALLYNRIPWIDQPQQQMRDVSAMYQLSHKNKPSIHLVQTAEERLATPPLLQSLLCALLQPTASKRLTARAALEHPLFAVALDKPLSVKREIEQDLMLATPISARRAFRTVLSLVRAVDCFRNSALSGFSQAVAV
eukprot:TRINITY_DN70955_c0_g1_i1.p1 TRINITY_DN70955_c0_g1~~TRINITY_DN70955_c0_g1_i1.p1  ORF type:complete len:573 (-),score=102.12 TRINITY_DN70955_c0_g1_i1:1280-2884(-)